MTNHENLVNLFESYLAESAKFDEKGNEAAGTRARKSAQELKALTQKLRVEILEHNKLDKNA